jgi:AcrR family transcriptional regulator
MARPTTITNTQILDAAREVFLEKGISATASEVARRAGVAEGSVFKRFKTKEELFIAALTPDEDRDAPWMTDLVARVGAPDLQLTLREIGRDLIGFLRVLMPLVLMTWSNAGSTGLPGHLSGPNPAPVRGLRALTAFFEAEIARGRLAPQDPELLARVFLGAMQNYVFFEVLLGGAQRRQLPPPDEYLQSFVSLLWNGAAPKPTARSRSTKKPLKPRSRRATAR